MEKIFEGVGHELRQVNGWFINGTDHKLWGLKQNRKANLQLSSGAFPRFDRGLAAALCKPEHLRSQFGVRFNAYLETCELQHEETRGRVMLNVISREFDTDRNTGAIVTALGLYTTFPRPKITSRPCANGVTRSTTSETR